MCLVRLHKVGGGMCEGGLLDDGVRQVGLRDCRVRASSLREGGVCRDGVVDERGGWKNEGVRWLPDVGCHGVRLLCDRYL